METTRPPLLNPQHAPGTGGSAPVDLMAVVNVGLTLHDGAGRLVYVNSRFFSEHFPGIASDVPEIQTRQRRGDYWREFHEDFDDTPAYRQLIEDESAGPLPQPVTLRARSGRFYRIEEQGWQGGIASVWTDVSELVGRENALRTAQAELELLNTRLADLALTDALTGLPNRRRFQAALAEARGRVGEGVPDAVGVIDLDFFKAVNDRFGHDAGDAVLVEAAARMARTLRPGDLLARLGGEEFGVLFRSVSLAQGSEAAESLRRILGARPFMVGVAEVELTASIGLAWLSAARSPEDSLRQADMALFKAKDGGRDMIFWDHPGPAAGEAGGTPAAATVPAASVAADLLGDEGLDAARLQQKYQAQGDQHPRFDRAAWRRARAEGRTLDHYWNWVDYCIALAFA
ncbi:GGDEF domain-containing protein [Variovorax saccharolyticus]|uniref:GGDEF domain-containing protein n=1 Tax=Variovorax saccharolyticus TaxID=3053516 RepID=UPI002577A336|nr:GGDEF domain-containing protein [Variovorax sp. J31P216]MDM0026138.1 GGDEF domain-containing protein [Variovorax sp. J31P216]